MIKRLFAPTILLVVCLALGSCSSVSGAVSDNWPTWLGGMPKDVPPRPGAPGYDEFLLHQQGKDTTGATAPATNANSAAPSVAATEKNSTQAAPPVNAPPNEQGTVQGGLY